MRIVILAGGRGTRMGSDELPKPMIKIGNRPILWHIMKHYSMHGFNNFVLCLGHNGDVIRNYFINYLTYTRDITIHINSGSIAMNRPADIENWTVTLAETGEDTNTGGRIYRIRNFVSDGEDFFLATYGDSLSDVPVDKVIEHHKKMGLVATMCVMHGAQRFGKAIVQDGKVIDFAEKPVNVCDWINGGFYVFSKRIFDYLDNNCVLEKEPLCALTNAGQLAAYEHLGSHRAMDTPYDVKALNDEWETGHACWKTW